MRPTRPARSSAATAFQLRASSSRSDIGRWRARRASSSSRSEMRTAGATLRQTGCPSATATHAAYCEHTAYMPYASTASTHALQRSDAVMPAAIGRADRSDKGHSRLMSLPPATASAAEAASGPPPKRSTGNRPSAPAAPEPPCTPNPSVRSLYRSATQTANAVSPGRFQPLRSLFVPLCDTNSERSLVSAAFRPHLAERRP